MCHIVRRTSKRVRMVLQSMADTAVAGWWVVLWWGTESAERIADYFSAVGELA